MLPTPISQAEPLKTLAEIPINLKMNRAIVQPLLEAMMMGMTRVQDPLLRILLCETNAEETLAPENMLLPPAFTGCPIQSFENRGKKIYTEENSGGDGDERLFLHIIIDDVFPFYLQHIRIYVRLGIHECRYEDLADDYTDLHHIYESCKDVAQRFVETKKDLDELRLEYDDKVEAHDHLHKDYSCCTNIEEGIKQLEEELVGSKKEVEKLRKERRGLTINLGQAEIVRQKMVREFLSAFVRQILQNKDAGIDDIVRGLTRSGWFGSVYRGRLPGTGQIHNIDQDIQQAEHEYDESRVVAELGMAKAPETDGENRNPNR
ncbi:hypothetical protein Tco_0649575, partial [Tanacetum coccineum]